MATIEDFDKMDMDDMLVEKYARRHVAGKSLSNNRFKLSRDSEQRGRISKIRDIANEFGANHPEFISLQIFGSLIQGYGINESDVDAVLVLDEDRLYEGKGENLGREGEHILSRIEEQERYLLELKEKIMKSLNLPKEKVSHVKLRVVSKESIKKILVQAPRNLDYLFCPAIGATKIRDYRKIIFDELESKGEQGERIWQSIMDQLCIQERDVGIGVMKSKHLYPQTIAEGKKRFL